MFYLRYTYFSTEHIFTDVKKGESSGDESSRAT